MSFDYVDEKKFKNLIKQISGTITEKDGELVPYHAIKGTGYIWCFQPNSKTMVRLSRGIKIFVLDFGSVQDEKCLAITMAGGPLIIEKEEIEEIGFD